MDKKKMFLIGGVVLVLLLLVASIISKPKQEEDELVGIVDKTEETESRIDDSVSDVEHELDPNTEQQPDTQNTDESSAETATSSESSAEEIEVLDVNFFKVPTYGDANDILRSSQYDDTVKYGADQVDLTGPNAPAWSEDFIRYLIGVNPEAVEHEAYMNLMTYNQKKIVVVNDYGTIWSYLVTEAEDGSASFKEVEIDPDLIATLAEGVESSDIDPGKN